MGEQRDQGVLVGQKWSGLTVRMPHGCNESHFRRQKREVLSRDVSGEWSASARQLTSGNVKRALKNPPSLKIHV